MWFCDGVELGVVVNVVVSGVVVMCVMMVMNLLDVIKVCM